jgi:hypothetical protein
MDKGIGKIFGKEKSRLSYMPDELLLMPTTAVGLEFEFEGVKSSEKMMEALAEYWEAHGDNSLHDNGLEFVFHSPMFGRDVISAVKVLLAEATTRKFKTSLRTGIHVHLDARDLSYPQLIGLVLYYLMFEPAIYSWVGQRREANNFCLPWYKTEGSLSDAAELLRAIRQAVQYNEHDIEVSKLADNFHKYAGLNLKPLHQYGSIEFRHLETVTDFTKVLQWINIPLALKKAALAAPESSMVVVNGVLNRGINKSLFHIFEEKTANEMIHNNLDLVKEIKEIGIPNAIELLSELDKASTFSPDDWQRQQKLDTHIGIERWQKRNFPKDLSDGREKPPPKSVLQPLDVAPSLGQLLDQYEVLPTFNAGEGGGGYAGQHPNMLVVDDSPQPLQFSDTLDALTWTTSNTTQITPDFASFDEIPDPDPDPYP